MLKASYQLSHLLSSSSPPDSSSCARNGTETTWIVAGMVGGLAGRLVPSGTAVISVIPRCARAGTCKVALHRYLLELCFDLWL